MLFDAVLVWVGAGVEVEAEAVGFRAELVRGTVDRIAALTAGDASVALGPTLRLEDGPTEDDRGAGDPPGMIFPSRAYGT